MNRRKILFLIFTFPFLIFIGSCVNLDQKTTLNEDGSGTINLHYWTKNSNLSMGDEIGGFSFTEEKARQNFTSQNTEVKNIKVEKNDQDSTTHVKLDIAFKDFNKLSENSGFGKIETTWIKGKEGMDFKYILERDTVNSKNFGANEYKLNYEFDFPGEVVSTNGIKEGTSVSWNKSIADLKENVEMNATIKSKSKICGIFGYEFPVIILFIMMYFYSNKKKERNKFNYFRTVQNKLFEQR